MVLEKCHVSALQWCPSVVSFEGSNGMNQCSRLCLLRNVEGVCCQLLTSGRIPMRSNLKAGLQPNHLQHVTYNQHPTRPLRHIVQGVLKPTSLKRALQVYINFEIVHHLNIMSPMLIVAHLSTSF